MFLWLICTISLREVLSDFLGLKTSFDLSWVTGLDVFVAATPTALFLLREKVLGGSRRLVAFAILVPLGWFCFSEWRTVHHGLHQRGRPFLNAVHLWGSSASTKLSHFKWLLLLRSCSAFVKSQVKRHVSCAKITMFLNSGIFLIQFHYSKFYFGSFSLWLGVVFELRDFIAWIRIEHYLWYIISNISFFFWFNLSLGIGIRGLDLSF